MEIGCYETWRWGRKYADLGDNVNKQADFQLLAVNRDELDLMTELVLKI